MLRLLLSEIDRLLDEDVASGDLTSEALALRGRRGRMRFAARGDYTVAGVEIAAQLLRRLDLEPVLSVRSGDAVASGATLLACEGDAADLHMAWKTSQTLVEVLSGIATGARAIVEAAQAVDPNVQVACTRKTFPGARRLCQHAVKAGGAILHRAGLSETILVFPEHLEFLPEASINEVSARLRRAAPEKKLAIEVKSLAEAESALAVGFDVVQLEKFSVDAVGEVAARARALGSHAVLAAAGGVNAGNAAAYVRAGAGLLVTSAPYSAPPRDVQVTFEALS